MASAVIPATTCSLSVLIVAVLPWPGSASAEDLLLPGTHCAPPEGAGDRLAESPTQPDPMHLLDGSGLDHGGVRNTLGARCGFTGATDGAPSRGADWLLGSPPDPPAPHYRVWLPVLVLGGALAGAHYGLDPPRDARWNDRNSFDDGIRGGVKGGSRSARESAATASTVILGGLGAGLAADIVMLRDEHPVLRSVGVDTSWFLANELATEIAKVSAGRERPYARPCRRNPDYVSDCDSGRDRNASFFSGHASTSASLAGLLCARHFGRASVESTDWMVCGGAASASVATGVLRIVADRHFATDVLTGWASGTLFGYVLPRWLDYSPNRADELDPRRSQALLLRTVPGGAAVQYSVAF